jgi:hypothetical protein
LKNFIDEGFARPRVIFQKIDAVYSYSDGGSVFCAFARRIRESGPITMLDSSIDLSRLARIFGALVVGGDPALTSQSRAPFPRCLIPEFMGAIFSPGWRDALWGKILHGSATTTMAVRRAIQNSQESLRALAKRYGINPKTVEKRKKRASTADRKAGPKAPKSTVLTEEEEAIVVAFRRHTLLALDDCLYALQATIPHFSRS